MRVAIVGAGPAGLTAARRLSTHGCEPVVYEAASWVGGRTRTLHFDNGHVLDAGAGWIASFYHRLLALLDELGMRADLVLLDLQSEAALSDRGTVIPVPQTPAALLRSPLLPWPDKARLGLLFVELLAADPFARLAGDPRYDREDAVTYVRRRCGSRTVDVVFRPAFSAVFSDLEELSAALVRAWVRPALGARFYSLADGIDSPWRRVAEKLDVRTSTPVGAIRVGSDGVEVVPEDGPAERFDAVVVAGPLTRMLPLIEGWEPAEWMREVRYAPHVRLYATRASESPRRDIHPLEAECVAQVSWGSGRLWGTCPPGRSAAVVGSAGRWCAELMALSDEDVSERLWARATEVDPDLFPLEEADDVSVIRWPEAVPVFAPGLFTRLRAFRQQPPLVFAGDWLTQPCMEGAVRAGEAAARILIR